MKSSTGHSTVPKHNIISSIGKPIPHQLETEIQYIHKIYLKTREEFAKAEGNPILMSRLKFSHDAHKWEKKFIQVFSMHRGVLDLAQDPREMLTPKNMILNP